MDPGATLQTLAEVSIAFTGFSALIVALRAPQVGGLHTQGNRLGLALLFGWSLAAVLMSLVPLVAGASGFAGRALWSATSAVAAAFFAVGAVSVAIANARLPAIERLGPVAIGLGSAVHLGALGALLWNAAGPASPGVLLGSILVMLGLAAWTRLYFIFPPGRDRRP